MVKAAGQLVSPPRSGRATISLDADGPSLRRSWPKPCDLFDTSYLVNNQIKSIITAGCLTDGDNKNSVSQAMNTDPRPSAEPEQKDGHPPSSADSMDLPGSSSVAEFMNERPRYKSNKWKQWRWWKRYFPEPNRRIEVLIITLVGLTIGLYIKIHETSITEKNSEMLRQQIELQNVMEKLIEAKSEAGVAAALLPYLSCSANTATAKMAIEIMQSSAKAQWRTVSAQFPENCAALQQAGIDPVVLREQAAQVADEAEFQRKISLGFQYYRDDLWESAARTWAAIKIPLGADRSHMLNLQDLQAAKQALDDGQYLSAADLFKRNFEKLATP